MGIFVSTSSKDELILIEEDTLPEIRFCRRVDQPGNLTSTSVLQTGSTKLSGYPAVGARMLGGVPNIHVAGRIQRHVAHALFLVSYILLERTWLHFNHRPNRPTSKKTCASVFTAISCEIYGVHQKLSSGRGGRDYLPLCEIKRGDATFSPSSRI